MPFVMLSQSNDEAVTFYSSNQQALSLYQDLVTLYPDQSYYGVDLEEKERELIVKGLEEVLARPMTNPSQNNLLVHEYLAKHEPARIENMSKNILKQLRQLEKSGGIVFLTNFGYEHVQRLWYSLATMLKNQEKEEVISLDVEIIALKMNMPKEGYKAKSHRLCASYQAVANTSKPDSGFSEEKAISLLGSKYDSEEAMEFYQNHPLLILEVGQGQEEDDFLCAEFDELVRSAARDLSKNEKPIQANSYVSNPHIIFSNKVLHQLELDKLKAQVQLESKPINQNSPVVFFRLTKAEEHERWLRGYSSENLSREINQRSPG